MILIITTIIILSFIMVIFTSNISPNNQGNISNKIITIQTYNNMDKIEYDIKKIVRKYNSVIVEDSGSTDDTLIILQKLQKKYQNLYIKHL
ncbi:MAG: hypothetical protein LBM38_02055 [Clostridiales bacterium]|jgi:hypothetical protein|nr:hypothetical protein [Clostridiales bacterium]